MLTERLLAYLPFALPFYLVRFKIGPLPTTLLEVYLGVIVVVFLYEEGWQGIRCGWSSLGRFRWPIIAWLVATIIAVFISPSIWTGLGLWRAYVLEPVFIFFVLKAVEQGQVSSIKYQVSRIRTGPILDTRYSILDTLSRNLFLVVIGLTLWALIQFVTGYGIPHPWNVAINAGRRATGPFPYPNALALFVVPIGAYALSKWVSRITYHVSSIRNGPILDTRYPIPDTFFSLDTQYLAPCATAASFLSVLLAKSDGGLIALSFVTWLALLLQKRLRPWILAVTCLGLLAVGVSSITYQVSSLRNGPILDTRYPIPNTFLSLDTRYLRFAHPLIHELTFQNWSGKVRLYMWRDTITMLKDHWFLGAGFGGYPTVFKPYQRTTGIEVFQYPHNILLNVWSETGLLGLLVFGWIIVTVVSSIMYHVSSIRTGPILDTRYSIPDTFLSLDTRYFFLLALLIHGLVDVPYFKNDLAILFWILVWLTTKKLVSGPKNSA